MTDPAAPKQHSVEYVTLRDYIDTCLDSRDKATSIAYVTMEKFRDTLQEQGAIFLTRSEYRAAQELIERDIRELREFRATMTGKASQSSVTTAAAVAAVSILLSVISIMLRIFGL